jgi:hypothetical protein
MMRCSALAFAVLLTGCPSEPSSQMSKAPPPPSAVPSASPLASSSRPPVSPPVASAPPVASPPDGSPPVLTREDQIEAHVGRVVTLEGVVSRSKIPTLLGVDVNADSEHDLRGKRARATGTIVKSTVTQQELDEQIARLGQFANRGSGTFYRLSGERGLARAVAVP